MSEIVIKIIFAIPAIWFAVKLALCWFKEYKVQRILMAIVFALVAAVCHRGVYVWLTVYYIMNHMKR